ncbi:MAG: sigma 54-interacting transcriptional regulator [Alphaproteobacteria bacterium]|uniref:Sigma 54-interacting transcriptional regulator n=1 Tax=Candidatus Nitrobium versatile TaxID=2884831 RepID=A0A953M262_9BACT|nr:sigma 54-interacting transcriptional regulator [Candidatus Nitrobium versatile]
MNTPFFEHTVAPLRAFVRNESESLQKAARLLKYDPGLYFSLLQLINGPEKRSEVSTVSQAISLLGAEKVEKHILQQESFLDSSFLFFWCYTVLAGETAVALNRSADVVEEEEAFFAGILPSVGMLLMLRKEVSYKKVLEILLKIPSEDKLFIEDRLFTTNHLEQLGRHLLFPKIYRDTVRITRFLFAPGGRRASPREDPARYSGAYTSLQLYHLMEASASAARCLLFPLVVEAQEKFRELVKRYFRIPESETEELLAESIERFEEICREFGVQDAAERFLSLPERGDPPGIPFFTVSEKIKAALDEVDTANRLEKNIALYGEAGVGKRLLAVALHRRPDNPRRNKPFLSYHCRTLDSETLEIELFGAKGGFLGLEKHRGALEMANGGSILLKDIDAVPLPLQEKLAEVFSKDEFYKIGEVHPATFDIRFFLTSRKDIVREAEEGRFSARLLEALNPVSMYIPPLRERRQDIGHIADSIIEKYDLFLKDPALRLGLSEYYEKDPFPSNLKSLKRLLLYLSAKHRLLVA